MAKRKKVLFSFRVKVTLALIFSIFLVMSMSNFFVYKFGQDTQFKLLREKLMVIAQTTALMVDTQDLFEIPLNRQGIEAPQYHKIAQRLKKVQDLNPSLKYIYIMAKTDIPGILQFVVDLDTVLNEDRKKGPTAFPGDKYNGSRFPEMLKGFNNASADKKIMIDEWGVTLSGYAPILDKEGKSVAILGVDMDAKDVYAAQRQLFIRAIFVLITGIVISIFLGLFVSRRITSRIEKIVVGTRHIASDDLDYKVEVRGNDEISELADSFNKMAVSLSDSRKKLREYFYRVVQSLVRILEAKDPYTRGHSERVSEYAKETAKEMGFSEEKSESVRKAAELHDIGKLVIEESILNKKTDLSQEEWDLIRNHPIVGEEALKPIFPEPDILAMVRSHHERYDGKGYPDGLRGDKINIFAQIVSVADAFDAMTTNRSYRPALDKKTAIEELKKKSGTQFNTQVVNAFLKALREKL